MSRLRSPSTTRTYGLERVCRAWAVPRSTLYHHRRLQSCPRPERPAQRRGPRPIVTDEDLLAMIRFEIESSPFHGEGYRKLHARVIVRHGVTAGRNRVLRLMRENGLLSPFRVRQGAPLEHKGTITTDSPDVMWGTDGTQVLTASEGLIWIFAAVDHWNAECVGWHVCKFGDRYAALKPLEMGLARHFGTAGRNAARGLAVRMDHGSQYVSGHFRNQLRFWGATESYGFVEQPQTNGVIERFFKTLKEQVVHGRIYRGENDLREAIRRFIETYNTQWLVEKLGHISPQQARLQVALPMAA